MPLSGEDSNRYGNRYEGKWTVFCLARLMNVEFDSIKLSPRGIEGAGCEFVLLKDGIKEYHQVKRQHSEPGSWTISKLFANGVLITALNKTLNSNHHFHFVSTVDSHNMNELCDAARKSKSYLEFSEEYISKGERRKSWKQLVKSWRPLIQQEVSYSVQTKRMTVEEKEDFIREEKQEEENTINEVAFGLLKRIFMDDNIGESILERMVESELGRLFEDDPKEIRIALADFVLENSPKELVADDLWRWSGKKWLPES